MSAVFRGARRDFGGSRCPPTFASAMAGAATGIVNRSQSLAALRRQCDANTAWRRYLPARSNHVLSLGGAGVFVFSRAPQLFPVTAPGLKLIQVQCGCNLIAAI